MTAAGCAGAGSTAGVLSGLRILVVDDDLLTREVARQLLEGEGATVRLAVNGAEAVEACLAAAPEIDIVLIDTQMPVLGGVAATAAIRARRNATDLPIIGVSSRSAPADIANGRGAGMNECLGKPYDLEQLIPLLLHHRPSPGRSTRAG